MRIKDLGKRLPPIAWRDAKLAEWRDKNRALRSQLATYDGTAAWEGPDLAQGAALVRRSGLFDEQWYRRQLDEEPTADTDLVEHYLSVGAQQGLSPHPAFLADRYVAQVKNLKHHKSRNRVESAALLHYLMVGAARDLSPHPLFDALWYADLVPEARSHPGGPLGHFLAGSALPAETPGLEGSASGPRTRWRDPQEFLRKAAAAAEVVHDTRGHAHLQRDSEELDVATEQAVKDALRQVQLPDPPPMVSVVLPTKDRAGPMLQAVDSVLAQSYPHWQLIVVDDGGTDDTAEVLAPRLVDERISYVTHEQSRGVSGARNTGLAHATGDYVAYLDSDNTWRADFLDLMVRFMVRDGHRVGYAMSALIEEGGEHRTLYRGMPFSREAMMERNYIDCIVLMHERRLLDVVGTFDESLRRNVDWELFIRMARECDFGYAPFVATQYDVWEDRTQRITTDEAVSYRFVVRQRALVDWDAQRAGLPDRDADLVSVVVVATERAQTAVTAVRRIQESARGRVEIVVVDPHLVDQESILLQMALQDADDVLVERISQPVPLEVARNVGATRTGGGAVVFLPDTAWCEPDWDRPLLAALADHAVVQPLTLTHGGAVWSAGVSFSESGRPALPYRGFAGDAPEVRGTRTVDGVTAACLAVRADDYVGVGGFDPLFVRHHTGAELALRVTEHSGRTAACVGSSHVSLRTEPPVPARGHQVSAWKNDQRLRRLWDGRPSSLSETLRADGYAVQGFLRLPGTSEATPIVAHDRPQRPLRWAIKIGAPSVEVRTNWGDWHFAEALRDSLERSGHEVSIDCFYDWHRPTAYLDDVVVVLRGVSHYECNPGHTNLCWVISHPERVSAAEMGQYDAVFGASPRWVERINPKLVRPAEVLLQCTDHRRFHPVEPDRRRAHPVLAVANARRMRPAVGAALEAGVVPAVYGLRWDGLLPQGAWQGPYVPNDQLAAVYAAAGVVLNDHWDDMRAEGLVSNRLFDLTACNARVISDHLPEIEHVFGDVVLTYNSPDDIPDLIATHRDESPQRRAAREEMGAHVREAHTFDARAQLLAQRVAQLRAREPARAK
ncbi:MAG: glycosyltransferase [Ornithinimicrobium sp.]|uniref:glycosyltransferase n=1 Tax=Ornithinimicrobium sp. TaxID=1977084 RepID=UPI003D9AEDA0